MRIRATTPVLLAWVWLVLSAGISVAYRALTQSLTMDESYVFHILLAPQVANLFQVYDAGYHVLHTWVSWLSVHWLGSSEIAIRLPSVVAGIFYLAGTGALCRRLLGDGWRYFFGVVLLTLNPMLLDYLSMARGYGAALMFFVWGFHALLGGRLICASMLFGFSVACNLTLAVPVFAACAIYIFLEAGRRARVLPLAGRLLFPFVLVAAPILGIPLGHARGTHFFYGAEDLGTALNTLIAPSWPLTRWSGPRG